MTAFLAVSILISQEQPWCCRKRIQIYLINCRAGPGSESVCQVDWWCCRLGLKTEILLAHLVCSLINSLNLHIAVFNSLCFFFSHIPHIPGLLELFQVVCFVLFCFPSLHIWNVFTWFWSLYAFFFLLLFLLSKILYAFIHFFSWQNPSCVLLSVPRLLPGQRLPCGIWPMLRKNPSSPAPSMRTGALWHPRRNPPPTSLLYSDVLFLYEWL